MLIDEKELKRKRIAGGILVSVLLLSLAIAAIAPFLSTAKATSCCDGATVATFSVEYEGGLEEVSWWYRLFHSGLYILGGGDVVLAHGIGWHYDSNDIPRLDNPDTTFNQGEVIGMAFYAYDVQDGETIYFKLCDSSGTACSDVRIKDYDGTARTYLRFEGDYPVYWYFGFFYVDTPGTYTLKVSTYSDEGPWEEWKFTERFTILPRQICQPYDYQCDGTMLQRCSSDGTVWNDVQYCTYGCVNDACKAAPTPSPTPTPIPTVKPTPTPQQICTPFSEYRCNYGWCEQCNSYGTGWDRLRYCDSGCSQNGCANGYCDSATTPTPTVYPSPSLTPTPTAVPPKPIPGFGAVFAMVGLLACAYLVLRRKR